MADSPGACFNPENEEMTQKERSRHQFNLTFRIPSSVQVTRLASVVTCSTAFMTAALIPQENEKQQRRDNPIPLFLSPDGPPNVTNKSLNLAALLSRSWYTWHYTHSAVILIILTT